MEYTIVVIMRQGKTPPPTNPVLSWELVGTNDYYLQDIYLSKVPGDLYKRAIASLAERWYRVPGFIWWNGVENR